MRRRTVLVATLVLLAGTLGGAVPAGADGPLTVEYPGASCPDTGDSGLQQCVDGLEAGSTVILTQEVIGETVVIGRSLTLRATTPDLRPRLRRIGVSVLVAGGPHTVTIRDIDLERSLAVSLRAGAGHRIVLDGLAIGTEAAGAEGASMTLEVPSTVILSRSTIRHVDGDQEPVLGIRTLAAGQVRVDVVGNRITAEGTPDAGAGIDLSLEGTGDVRINIASNAIWRVATCNCGIAAGISIAAEPDVRAHVDVIGNTVVRSAGSGLSQRRPAGGPGGLTLRMFDNAITHNATHGIRLDDSSGPSLEFQAGHNASHRNGQPDDLDGRSPGTGNVRADPRYRNLSKANLRLRGDSPLVDTGRTCVPGGIASHDAEGMARLAGRSVDIGAYERGAGAATGIAVTGDGSADTIDGTAGDDVLCGLGGPDVIDGKGGRDHIDGGPGGDLLIGGRGPDLVIGGNGSDVLCTRDGTSGNDRAEGGPGTDSGRFDAGDVRVSVERAAAC